MVKILARKEWSDSDKKILSTLLFANCKSISPVLKELRFTNYKKRVIVLYVEEV
jgi:hypothetical protein